MDHALTFANMPAAGYTTGQLHPNSIGRVYNDPGHAATVAAAKTEISTYVCPAVPVQFSQRSPDGFGAFDYMFIAVSDVEDGSAGATDPVGTRPSNAARRIAMTIQGMLTCEGRTIAKVTDGASNTILVIEDAGRAHPSAGQWASLSSRPSPVNEGPQWSGGASNGRRMYAWADPDTVTNGFSGPSNALAPAGKVIAVNQNNAPLGGPPTCLWTVNNCGPNDEPFSFHGGGVNTLMGDGSVRFILNSAPPMTLKYLAGATDGQVVSLD
jgi:prepilin-type processing-associated H-X9-DG protein